MDIILQIQALLAPTGIPLPPIPRELTGLLHPVRSGQYFTSHPSAPSPWNIRWHLDELTSKKVDDYMVIGFAGHGVESQAMHYYLVTQDIALFHQSALSSPYGGQLKSEHLQKQYELAASIIIAAEDAKTAGNMSEDSRLVIVNGCTAPSMWGIQALAGRPVDRWQQQDTNGMLAAAEWLADMTAD